LNEVIVDQVAHSDVTNACIPVVNCEEALIIEHELERIRILARRVDETVQDQAANNGVMGLGNPS